MKYRSPGARRAVEDIFKILEAHWTHTRQKMPAVLELDTTDSNTATESQSQPITPDATRRGEDSYTQSSSNPMQHSGHHFPPSINTVTPTQLVTDIRTRIDTDTCAVNAVQELIFNQLFDAVLLCRKPFIYEPSGSIATSLATTTVSGSAHSRKQSRLLNFDIRCCPPDIGVPIQIDLSRGDLDFYHRENSANGVRPLIKEGMILMEGHLSWMQTIFPVTDIFSAFSFEASSSTDEGCIQMRPHGSPHLILPRKVKVSSYMFGSFFSYTTMKVNIFSRTHDMFII